jgi:hypothetical protein
MCKTNPIGQEVGRGRPTHSTIAQGGLYEELKHAEQTQFCPGGAVNAQNEPNLTPTTKVAEAGFDPHFWADIAAWLV